jgi:hypothetical protein
MYLEGTLSSRYIEGDTKVPFGQGTFKVPYIRPFLVLALCACA